MDYHILVAEDEPKIRMILQDYFHSRGDRVTPAENGLQALELAESDDFDAILLDRSWMDCLSVAACGRRVMCPSCS